MRLPLTALFVVLTITSGFAQEGGCRISDCIMKPAGNYYIELAGCNGTIDIFVYDRDQRPLRNMPITGFVEFYYLDETSLRTDFVQYYATNRLSARIAGPGFRNCRVLLHVGGEEISAFFHNLCELRAATPLPKANSE